VIFQVKYKFTWICQIQGTEIAASPIYSNFLYSASSKSFFLQGIEIAASPEIITFIISKIIEYSGIQNIDYMNVKQ